MKFIIWELKLRLNDDPQGGKVNEIEDRVIP
jgi:hypothetical protein